MYDENLLERVSLLWRCGLLAHVRCVYFLSADQISDPQRIVMSYTRLLIRRGS